MSLSTLRTPLRRVVAGTPARLSKPQTLSRNPAFKRWNSSSSAPPPNANASSKNGIYAGIGAATIIGAFAFYTMMSNGDGAAAKATNAAKSGAQAAKVAANFVPSKEDYQKVYNTIAEIMDDAGDYDDGSYGPVLLRLAWHSSGTYDAETKTGGSNFATMRFEPESLHGANNGLDVARNLMQKVKEQYPDRKSVV